MEELKNNIAKLGKSITKASGKLIKSTKLNLKLSSEEEKIRKIYIEIGQKVHEIYSYGGNIGKFFDEKYIEIVEAEEKIKEIKNLINLEKEKPFETERGNVINTQRQAIIDTTLENKFNDEIIEQDYKICNSCGEKNNINDKFCLKCGRGI